MLEWKNEKTVDLDGTVLFGKGYDFFGLEELSLSAEGPNGNYLIWPYTR